MRMSSNSKGYLKQYIAFRLRTILLTVIKDTQSQNMTPIYLPIGSGHQEAYQYGRCAEMHSLRQPNTPSQSSQRNTTINTRTGITNKQKSTITRSFGLDELLGSIYWANGVTVAVRMKLRTEASSSS